MLRLLFIYIITLSFFNCETAYKDSDDDKFFYFAYGSNLLKSRMHINCPSAEFYSSARLEGWRLDFNISASTWNGAVATICKDRRPGSKVWGSLWKIPLRELPQLDKQEGVDSGIYYATNVTVVTPGGEEVVARVYIQTVSPKYEPVLPKERQPSRTYHTVIFLGAIECRLPANYIDYIQSFQNNGKLAQIKRRKQLGYPFFDDTTARVKITDCIEGKNDE